MSLTLYENPRFKFHLCHLFHFQLSFLEYLLENITAWTRTWVISVQGHGTTQPIYTNICELFQQVCFYSQTMPPLKKIMDPLGNIDFARV